MWAGGGISDDRDEALVKLSPGQKWQAKIEDIGLVAGVHPLTQPEVTGTKYKVAKRGRTTKLTGGTIAAMRATTHVADNLILIDPNPDPEAGGGDVVFFDIEGDSGSALVNSANEVVGLVWGRNDVGQGFAYEIGHVLGRLKTIDQVTVEVASTTDPNEVRVVPGATLVPLPPEMADQIAGDPEEQRVFLGENGRAPLARPWFADVPPPAPTVQQAFADLAVSDSGRLLFELWQLHREELLRLLDTDRRVAIGWHRGGGAALLQLVLRMPAHPDRPLPDTLYGEPLTVVLDRVHALFASHASQALRADLTRARELLPGPRRPHVRRDRRGARGRRTRPRRPPAGAPWQRAGAPWQRAGASWLAPQEPSNTWPSSWPGCSAGRPNRFGDDGVLDTFDELGVHFPDEFLTAPRITAARQTSHGRRRARGPDRDPGQRDRKPATTAASRPPRSHCITQCGRVSAAFPELATALHAEGPRCPGITQAQIDDLVADLPRRRSAICCSPTCSSCPSRSARCSRSSASSSGRSIPATRTTTPARRSRRHPCTSTGCYPRSRIP